MLFKDRVDAGKRLADNLKKYKNKKNLLILALPRGGVVVAKPISRMLNAILDLIIPRKIGAPENPELAIGAICENEYTLNDSLILSLSIDEKYIKDQIEKEKKEAERRKQIYRKGKKEPEIQNRRIILVDDGIATGSTMKASIKYVRSQNPQKIIVAIPVAPRHILEELSSICDEIICLYSPINFMAIGQFYENFSQTTDEEVLALL